MLAVVIAVAVALLVLRPWETATVEIAGQQVPETIGELEIDEHYDTPFGPGPPPGTDVEHVVHLRYVSAEEIAYVSVYGPTEDVEAVMAHRANPRDVAGARCADSSMRDEFPICAVAADGRVLTAIGYSVTTGDFRSEEGQANLAHTVAEAFLS
ncbi:hypothetical protein [Georgenia alba]|uniref:DUF4367 domain-containing protein n=1 Tax=Georgenia alba TaxID=2233858 RepID=A0ABW2Q3K3_9MICO